MKKFFTLVFLVFTFLNSKSQITAGDIAIIAMNSDNNASPILGENFVFVALKGIPANTTITFTDCAWNATADTFRTNEGYIQWVHTDSVIAGTVIVINSLSANSWATPSPSLGTATGVSNMAFSTDGDQIIAFEGTWATRPTVDSSSRFLFAFSLENFITAVPSTSQESNLPSALASFNAAMKLTNTETDNAYFADGATAVTAVSVSGSKTELLAKFMDSTKYFQSNTLSALPTYVTVLPVTLKSISGSLINNQPQVNWETSNETNFDYFGVEKSFDAKNFAEIAKVASNKASNGSAYQYADIAKTLTTQFYRLKMVDNDGTFKYSSVVAVNGRPSLSLALYPNPVTNTIILSHPKAMAGAAVKVVGIDGKILSTQNIQTGATQTSIDATRLVKGNYVVSFVNDGVSSTTQLVKQ